MVNVVMQGGTSLNGCGYTVYRLSSGLVLFYQKNGLFAEKKIGPFLHFRTPFPSLATGLLLKTVLFVVC